MEQMKLHNAKLQKLREVSLYPYSRSKLMQDQAAIDDENEWGQIRTPRQMRLASKNEKEETERNARRLHMQQAINDERAKVAQRKLDKMQGRDCEFYSLDDLSLCEMFHRGRGKDFWRLG